MIDLIRLEEDVNKGKISNSYILCGLDEILIKESTEQIINKVLIDDFKELNLVKIDGNNINYDEVLNACETLPFMSEKKVVYIYRANFLRDGIDKAQEKVYKQVAEYLKNPPEHCVIIAYFLFDSKRDRVNKQRKVMALDKKCTVVNAERLKGERLYKKVNALFEVEGKNINKVELKLFCDLVENNMDIIKREVDKLVNYTMGRDIKREDIIKLLPSSSEDDVFDLVDFISQKRPEKAIELMNGLINKGENIMVIVALMEGQFNKLYRARIAVEMRKSKDELAVELRLPPFICEKIMAQSRKFSLASIEKCMKLCIETEKTIKSTSADKNTEVELLIINSVRV